MTVIIQKFDYGVTVFLEKINDNMVFQYLVCPHPPFTHIKWKLLKSKEKYKKKNKDDSSGVLLL